MSILKAIKRTLFGTLPVNLITHFVYPEIIVLGNGDWTAKLMTTTGEILDEFSGHAYDRGEAKKQALKMIGKVEENYRRIT